MSIDRRRFLASAIAVSGGVALALERAIAQAPTIRRDINTLQPGDPIIESFRDAVTLMHGLSATDERSWTGQARIHLDHCHRQRRHFLSWHRLYIRSFEEIVRELTGEENWALPYWNWTADPQIPLAFFGGGNPLDTLSWDDADPQAAPNVDRIIGPNDTLAAWAVDVRSMETRPLFPTFSDWLEGGPHGAVHNAVGGHMRRFLSPLDPIFWVHHCNVDRLWVRWSRTFTNPDDPAWLDEPFDGMFADRAGNLIGGITAGDLLDTAALGYIYDEQAEAGPADTGALDATLGRWPADIQSLFESAGVSARNEVPSTLNVPTNLSVPAPETLLLPRTFFDTAALGSGQAEKRIVARLSEIQIPVEADHYVIRVFLNCPYLSPAVPPTDPHHVADINLFGFREMPEREMRGGHSGRGRDMLLDLTQTMVQLNRRQTPVESEFDVQLMPVATGTGEPQGTEFLVGRIEIVAL